MGRTKSHVLVFYSNQQIIYLNYKPSNSKLNPPMLRKSRLLRMFGNQYILTIIALSAAVYAYFVFPGTALLKESNRSKLYH